MPGVLSVVGTPIGNLEDASPRVRRVLGEADVVLCEDTRVTGRLLSALGLRARLERCDENVMERRVASVLERLAAGERVAFVSDAGMPGVSDPGQRLVDAALDAGARVEVVPGTLVVYESPRRVAETLANVAEVMGGRRVALVRELTKLHEEVVRGEASELAAEVTERGEVRGECVIVIAAPGSEELAARRAAASGPEHSLEEEIAAGLAAGEPKSALAKRLARTFGLPRAEVYDAVVSAAG